MTNSEKWPADGLEHVVNCPVCSSTKRELLYHGLTVRIFFCAPREWTLYRCQKCGSSYLDPRPIETNGWDPNQYRRLSLVYWLTVWRAERKARKEVTLRKFITVKAQKL